MHNLDPTKLIPIQNLAYDLQTSRQASRMLDIRVAYHIGRAAGFDVGAIVDGQTLEQAFTAEPSKADAIADRFGVPTFTKSLDVLVRCFANNELPQLFNDAADYTSQHGWTEGHYHEAFACNLIVAYLEIIHV